MVIRKKPVALVILDGFGYSQDHVCNAILEAKMKTVPSWILEYPHALLEASGHAVGLPKGMAGNSLVGHMTIGAGRVIDQPLMILNRMIDTGLLCTHERLKKNLERLKKGGGTLHLMGLLSDAGNHSHENHLFALMRCAAQAGVKKLIIHPFLDGRDVLPASAEQYLQRLDLIIKEVGIGVIGTLQGRYYAMERSDRNDKVPESFAILTSMQSVRFHSWRDVIDYYYQKGIFDEYIPPTSLIDHAYMVDDDALIFFNIRSDRARSLTRLFLSQKNLHLLWMMTAVSYGSEFSVDTLCPAYNYKNTLLDELELHHKSMFVVAEHEKYAHVTYFFNGGNEIMHAHETRMIIPSIHPDLFVEHPEMSAPEITEVVMRSLTKNPRDFYLINYANSDMIGHTGNFEATVRALQCIDTQLIKLYHQIVDKMDGTMIIIADHGKAERMCDVQKKGPRTAHTMNPVLFIILEKELHYIPQELPLTGLADVAPFILKKMKLPVPESMTGNSQNGSSDE